ncbi:MAG: fatty acid desaturase [Symbiobacteriia bacterium]
MQIGDPEATASRAAVAPFEHPDLWRSLWAVINTLVPFFVLWYLMYRSLSVSYWLTLALALPASGFYVRAFILFHDCGHGALFPSRLANDVLGVATGVLTLTPYYAWRHEHAMHHAAAGNLDRRGVGDIRTLTVREYEALPPLRRLVYRVYRNSAAFLLFGPVAVFVITQRFFSGVGGRRERHSVYTTNLILLAVVGIMWATIGLKAFLLVHLPIVWIGGAIGIWLFYVQHQFEGTTWDRQSEWDFTEAALHGSSFLPLPRLLDWFSGSIGYHHIHHLSPRIPHYLLARCYGESPVLHVTPLPVWAGIKAMFLALWDEDEHRLVGFRAVRRVQSMTRLRAH